MRIEADLVGVLVVSMLILTRTISRICILIYSVVYIRVAVSLSSPTCSRDTPPLRLTRALSLLQ